MKISGSWKRASYCLRGRKSLSKTVGVIVTVPVICGQTTTTAPFIKDQTDADILLKTSVRKNNIDIMKITHSSWRLLLLISWMRYLWNVALNMLNVW